MSADIPKKSRVARGPRSAPKTAKSAAEPEESCVICANPMEFVGVTPCQHQVCHKCLLRQRVLYGKSQCLVCRSDNPRAVVASPPSVPFEDYKKSDFIKHDNAKWGVDFADRAAYDASMSLLRAQCPICSREFAQLKQLEDHARTEHNKHYCGICAAHKKAFVSELPLYTAKQLNRHQTSGDEDGFSGHPECRHCKTRFYSVDELNIHIRHHHERCHLCDQQRPKTASYYKNYASLYQHFKRDHYVCSVPSCVEKGFVVFGDDLELTAHMLKEHGGVGASNKVVIGSSFHSQLSARPNSTQQRHFEANNDGENPSDPEVKRKRFEERAKHYAKGKSATLKEFHRVNNQFRSRKMTARDIASAYRDLFKVSEAETALLVHDFAAVMAAQPDLAEQLNQVADQQSQEQSQNAQFPVLTKSARSTPVLNQGWVGTSQGSRKDNFPVLKKKAPVATKAPLSYNGIVAPQPTHRVSVNRQQANFTPSYLSSPSPSPSSSASSSRVPSVNDNRFPALQKKEKKKIARVNQYNIPDPNSWGAQMGSSSRREADFGVGIKVVDKRKGKKKAHNTSDLL
ncbi:E3 ubiquitin-protein ligase Hel2p [Diutina catenulata]